jgi:hypothetical protein
MYTHRNKSFILLLILLIAGIYSCKTTKKLPPPPPPPVLMDADSDGVPDDHDKCPGTAGIAAFNGCPDTDLDGIEDAEDRCPEEPGPPGNRGCPSIDYVTSPPPDTTDYTSGTGTQPVETTGRTENNHTQKPGQVKNNSSTLPQASIAYGYKNKMKVGTTMDIRVRVELNKNVEEVEAVLKKIMNEKKAVTVSSTDSTITKSLVIAGDKYFRIEPFYDHTVFTVDSIGEQTKPLNTSGPTNWSWRVKALKPATESDIELKVYAIDENMVRHERDNGVMYVMVSVDSNNTTVVPGRDNPPVVPPSPSFISTYGWLLAAGILLGAAFLFFAWKKRKAGDTKPAAIYFSYAWDQQETIIDQLYLSLKNDGFNVVRDKTNLQYRGAISDFMMEIGKARQVVVAISDKYLRSRFCMFELYEIYKNAGMDKEEFSRRIFPLRIENISLGEPAVINSYVNYWEEEEKKWDLLIKENSDNITPEQTKQYQAIKRIVTELTGLLQILADMNSLNISQLMKNDFAEIKKALKQEFGPGSAV